MLLTRCGENLLKMVDNTSTLIHRLELLTDELIINKKAAKDIESRFNELFLHSNLAVTLVDESGKFIKSNGKLEKLLGYSTEELLTLSYQDITHIDDLYFDMELAHNLIKASTITSYSMIKRYYKKDNGTVWILLLVSKIADPNGKFKYYLSQILDLSPMIPLLDIPTLEKARKAGNASIGIWKQ